MPDFGTELLTITKASTLTVADIPETVEVPFVADLSNVTLTVGTAPTGSNVVVDILRNGGSVYDHAVGTVAAASVTAQASATAGVDASTATWVITPAPGAERVLARGVVLQCEREMVQVAAVAGSSRVEQSTSGTVGDLTLTVTRGYGGTTGASHAAAEDVYVALPFIPDGANESGLARFPAPPLATAVLEQSGGSSPSQVGNPLFAAGDEVQASITVVGSSDAGADLTVTLELTQR